MFCESCCPVCFPSWTQCCLTLKRWERSQGCLMQVPAGKCCCRGGTEEGHSAGVTLLRQLCHLGWNGIKFDAKFTVALGRLGAETGNKCSSEQGEGLFDAAEEFEVTLDYWTVQSNCPSCWQLTQGKTLSLLTYSIFTTSFLPRHWLFFFSCFHRLYNQLAEVKIRNEEKRRQQTYAKNREKAKEFQKVMRVCYMSSCSFVSWFHWASSQSNWDVWMEWKWRPSNQSGR